MRKPIRDSLNNADEPGRAFALLIPFVVPNSVGIGIQVQNRTQAETSTILRAT
jgi:hypothetical protein